MLVLATNFGIQAIHSTLSEMFVPLDSEDKTGEAAAGWIAGTALVLAAFIVSWILCQALIWAIRFLDTRKLFALRKMGKRNVDEEAQIILNAGNWRDDILEGNEQQWYTEPDDDGGHFCRKFCKIPNKK